LRRNAVGVYAEAFAPIVGPLSALPWAKRVELSLAIRRDVYRNSERGVAGVGSNNPKVGIMWMPLTALALRGTFATSFRVAPPAQTDPSSDIALLLPFSSPNGPGTFINTLYLIGGNSHLRPEVARTFTAGFELKPIILPDSSLSATYFHVTYKDRIAAPPVLGSVTSAFSQLGTLSPYINSAPSAADIQTVYNHDVVLDPTGIGRGGVQAIFNSTLQNIASTQASGVELTLRSKVKTGYGDFSFMGQGQYLAQLKNQAAPTTPYVSVVGTVFNPPDLRMQAGIGWSNKAWSVSMMSDYTSSFRDTLVAGAPKVGSWLTLNSSVTYTTKSRFAVTPHGSTIVVLSVNNLADRPAPYVKGLATQTLGYDPTNASVLGRAIRFEIRQRW
jgi:iron complex outermembrane receptor protein